MFVDLDKKKNFFSPKIDEIFTYIEHIWNTKIFTNDMNRIEIGKLWNKFCLRKNNKDQSIYIA